MKTNLYSIRDTVAEDFGPIFQAPNHATARRNYNNLLVSVPDTIKEDYQLFHIGYFDTSLGIIEQREKNELVDTKERSYIADQSKDMDEKQYPSNNGGMLV